MKLMGLELDDKGMMKIRFLSFCKREIIWKQFSGLQGLETKFLIELFLGSFCNSSSYRLSDVILNRF